MHKKIWLVPVMLVLAANCSIAFAENSDAQPKPAVITVQTPVSSDGTSIFVSEPKRATLTQNDVHNQYAIALNRFIQSNAKSAYADFSVLVESIVPNDYAYLKMASNMADIGFFDLSDLAMSKISEDEISYILTDDIRHFYFPGKKLSREDEIYLAEVFANIIYNDQSREATNELLKNTSLLQRSDYANYLVALGYSKANDASNANKYIDIAISQNQKNLNYKKLKAEIVAQTKKPQNALKIVNLIKQQKVYSSTYSNKVSALEQYILYKTKKNDYQKNYHLAYYYYYDKDLTKALRTLQSGISSKKNNNKEIYSLLSRVYFDMKEYEKAQDSAIKAHKLNGNDVMSMLVMGDLKFKNKDYKNALKDYQEAASEDSNSYEPLLKIAKTYTMLGKDKKAKEFYAKILKVHSDSYEAYYYMALMDKEREISYLKKAVAVNFEFVDGWLELGRAETQKKNFELAKKYLKIAKYIDENNFKYYYYQGLLSKAQGSNDEAKINFKRSLDINPSYEPAKEELSI